MHRKTGQKLNKVLFSLLYKIWDDFFSRYCNIVIQLIRHASYDAYGAYDVCIKVKSVKTR